MSFLAGKRVAFTGQLASMTRPEAADLVRAHGGTFITSVTRKTAYLVVGQEGWPLRKDGTLSGKLETARHLQSAGCPVVILTEEELLQRLGLEDASSGIHKRFTLAQLGRLLKVPRDRLRAWMRAGLLEPIEAVQGVCYFDFHQVTGIRTLWELTRAGVTTSTLRRSLEQLAAWLPGLGTSLAQLRLLEREGHVLMRLESGELVEASGQRHFDFEDASERASVTAVPASPSGVEVVELAAALEDAGRLEEAADAYRDALLANGPDAVLCFNLANVLYQLGQPGAAAERYRQALELNRECPLAWNNLGNALVELGRADDAVAAYRRALEIQPTYADAHYNAADVLEQLERFSEARRHWKEYLRYEPLGPWADYARKRLAN